MKCQQSPSLQQSTAQGSVVVGGAGVVEGENIVVEEDGVVVVTIGGTVVRVLLPPPPGFKPDLPPNKNMKPRIATTAAMYMKSFLAMVSLIYHILANAFPAVYRDATVLPGLAAVLVAYLPVAVRVHVIAVLNALAGASIISFRTY